MKMFDWKKIIRGIREKLSYFTAFFITAIIIIASIFTLAVQYRALDDNLSLKVGAVKKYISSAVEDIEISAKSLIMVETFKENAKEKKRELQKYQSVQYFQKTKEANLGLFKIKMGGMLGKIVGKETYAAMGSTFFSQYLSDKDIEELETNVRLQFRDRNGKIISDREFQKLKGLAGKAAKVQMAYNAAVNKTNDSSSSKKDDLEKKIAELEKDLNKANKNLRKEIFGYYKNEQKRKISELSLELNKENDLDLSLDKIRIQSYSIHKLGNDIEAVVGFDTVSFLTDSKEKESASKINGDKMLDFAEKDFQEFLSVLKKNSEEKPFLEKVKAWIIKPKSEEDFIKDKRDFKFEDRAFRIQYSINYSQYPIVKRIRALTAFSTGQEWKEYLENEKAVQKKFSEISGKIKTRLEALRKEKINKPLSDDLIFRNLYSEYSKVIAERKKLADETLKKLKHLTEYEKRHPESYSFPPLLEKEAMLNLRDAALYEKIVLKYKSSQYEYEDFIEADSKTKQSETEKWKKIREWIINAKSEAPPAELKKLISGGIINKSRSEAEEIMWDLDMTPILSGENESGLTDQLLDESKAGFIRIITDMQDGYDGIWNNLKTMLSVLFLIGIAGTVSAFYFSGRVVKKIKKIINSADELGKGNLDTKFEHGGSDEFGILTTALNKMTADLKHRHEMMMEYAAAEDIQKGLLPVEMPSNSTGVLQFGNFYKSMSGVGGDYYDYMNSKDGKTAFCIGDVSNHGIGPALVMVALRSHLHSLIRSDETDLLKILLLLNEQVYQDTPSHIFVTFFLGMFDPKDGTVTYCSCGHSKPALYRADSNKVELLGSGGMPLGAIDNDIFETTLEVCTVTLKKGDIFFQYTDGLNEAMNSAGELYGTDRMENIIQKTSKDNVENLTLTLARDAEEFSGKKIFCEGPSELNDDIAIIAFKRI